MFSQTIKETTRGHRVHCVILVEMRVTPSTLYFHNENGVFTSRGFDGELEPIKWLGMQGKAAATNLGASRIGASRQVTCSLNASNSAIRDWFFEDEQRQIKGKKFRFWGQFYDKNLQPLDPRFHIYTGIGDRLRMAKAGASSRRIELLLEDWLVRRRRSANSMVTNSDQQQRDPGSTGFIFVQRMVDQTLNLFDARN